MATIEPQLTPDEEALELKVIDDCSNDESKGVEPLSSTTVCTPLTSTTISSPGIPSEVVRATIHTPTSAPTMPCAPASAPAATHRLDPPPGFEPRHFRLVEVPSPPLFRKGPPTAPGGATSNRLSPVSSNPLQKSWLDLSRTSQQNKKETHFPQQIQPLAEKADQPYQDLHLKISSRSFNSRVAQTLTSVVEVVSSLKFLNMSGPIKGGSVGKGTAIANCTDAEVVYLVEGLPVEGHCRWMPPLLAAAAKIYSQKFKALAPTGHNVVSSIEIRELAIRIHVKRLMWVDVKFVPAIAANWREAVQAIGRSVPSCRKYMDGFFIREQTNLVSKQSGQVKVTIRLLKWWRDQQIWTSELTKPADYLLELIAIYACQQSKPRDQYQSIANCMNLLARFDELRIVWTNFYDKTDIWAPLLLQKPLLMDPVNPFVNIAGPEIFDARETMELAAVTHFFW